MFFLERRAQVITEAQSFGVSFFFHKYVELLHD